MSVNVYLKGEKVREVTGFEVIEPKEKDGSRKQYRLPGLDLSFGKGRWYFMLHEPNASIPLIVADIVEEVSFHTWISSSPGREAGIYHYESAEAEVEFPEENSIWVCIKAEKMEDLRKLYRKIRIGSIRPAESYEGKQDGMSRVQLEEKLKRSQDKNTELSQELKNLWNKHTKLNEKLTALTEKANRFSRYARWLVGLFRKLSFRNN